VGRRTAAAGESCCATGEGLRRRGPRAREGCAAGEELLRRLPSQGHLGADLEEWGRLAGVAHGSRRGKGGERRSGGVEGSAQ